MSRQQQRDGGGLHYMIHATLFTFRLTIIYDYLYEDCFLRNIPSGCKFLFDYDRISLIWPYIGINTAILPDYQNRWISGNKLMKINGKYGEDQL